MKRISFTLVSIALLLSCALASGEAHGAVSRCAQIFTVHGSRATQLVEQAVDLFLQHLKPARYPFFGPRMPRVYLAQSPVTEGASGPTFTAENSREFRSYLHKALERIDQLMRASRHQVFPRNLLVEVTGDMGSFFLPGINLAQIGTEAWLPNPRIERVWLGRSVAHEIGHFSMDNTLPKFLRGDALLAYENNMQSLALSHAANLLRGIDASGFWREASRSGTLDRSVLQRLSRSIESENRRRSRAGLGFSIDLDRFILPMAEFYAEVYVWLLMDAPMNDRDLGARPGSHDVSRYFYEAVELSSQDLIARSSHDGREVLAHMMRWMGQKQYRDNITEQRKDELLETILRAIALMVEEFVAKNDLTKNAYATRPYVSTHEELTELNLRFLEKFLLAEVVVLQSRLQPSN